MFLVHWKDIYGAKHKLERKWRRTKLKIDHNIYRIRCASVNKMLQAQLNYYSEKIVACQMIKIYLREQNIF